VAGLVGAGRVCLCYAASTGPQEMETWARERKGGGGGKKAGPVSGRSEDSAQAR
jgi:hypothetical protein